MTVWDILGNFKTEANTKNVLLYIMLMSDEASKSDCRALNLSVESICDVLGMGKGQVYRAQSQLKKYGLLKITPTYSKATGKKEFDTYEFIS